MKTKKIMENKPVSQGLQSYSKSQIAAMYMPDIEPKSALRNLNIWIKTHPTLEHELIAAGATPKMRRYTPLQITLIFKAFGEP